MDSEVRQMQQDKHPQICLSSCSVLYCHSSPVPLQLMHSVLCILSSATHLQTLSSNGLKLSQTAQTVSTVSNCLILPNSSAICSPNSAICSPPNSAVCSPPISAICSPPTLPCVIPTVQTAILSVIPMNRKDEWDTHEQEDEWDTHEQEG